jgi:Arc/MetJ family transcription regulator
VAIPRLQSLSGITGDCRVTSFLATSVYSGDFEAAHAAVATLGHFGPSDTFDAEDYVGTYSDLMNMPSVARNGGEKMRTTLNLPDNLMEEALRITRFRSKKDVVIHSLRELIRKKRLEELKDMKGKIDLEIDLNRSRRRKR